MAAEHRNIAPWAEMPRGLSVKSLCIGISLAAHFTVSRDPMTFKGHLMPSVDKTSSCAAVLSYSPPLYELCLYWLRSEIWVWHSDVKAEIELNCECWGEWPQCASLPDCWILPQLFPRKGDCIPLIKIAPEFVLNSYFWKHCPYVILYILQNTCNSVRAPSTIILSLEAGFLVLEE